MYLKCILNIQLYVHAFIDVLSMHTLLDLAHGEILVAFLLMVTTFPQNRLLSGLIIAPEKPAPPHTHTLKLNAKGALAHQRNL